MKIKNNIITIILLALSISGCNDFLEDDLQFTAEEVVTQSGQRSRGLIDDIYRDYAFVYFNDFQVESLADNSVYNTSETALARGNWGPTENLAVINNVWQTSYNNLRQIYQYIDLVHDEELPFFASEANATLNEIIIKRYYGEAFFLKAWAEWELLKAFGGPSSDGIMLGFPIINEILENEEYAKISRNTYDECVDQIMADLDVAIANLPLKYEGSGNVNIGENAAETGRASGLAAYALKAKVALFAASPAFNITNDITKWERAATFSHELIVQNGGLKELQLIDNSREDNPDQIWRMRTGRQNNSLEANLYPPTLYGQGLINPSQNLVDAFPASNGYPITSPESSYDATAPYASRDNRFYQSIFYNEDKCYSSEDCTEPEFDALEIFQGGLDNYGGFVNSTGTRTGYYMKKFLSNLDLDPSSIDATRTLPKVHVQLGLTEIYLSYSEAVNEAYGQPETTPAGFNFSAKDVIAMVRKRAGLDQDPYLNDVSTNQLDFRNFVKNERRIELAFTGERFHDLRRWKDIVNTEDIKGVKITKNNDGTFSYENIDVEKRVYESKSYYLPLPYSELLLNTNLKQNQGW